MVGKNLINHSSAKKYSILKPNSQELNLLSKENILSWIKRYKIDTVIHCAGLVGGIQANINNPNEFLFQNLQMGINLVDACFKTGIKNIINLGSSCMYPKNINHSIDESQLLSGKLEQTNEGYAIAKISVAKYCELISNKNKVFNYKTLIPCNIYGKYDDFSVDGSHMIPGVITRMFRAKQEQKKIIEIWGDGTARREFMYAEDLADGIWFCVKNIQVIPSLLNIGIGKDFSIIEYYKEIAKSIGYDGEFIFDTSKPIGMKKKLIDSTKINKLGWKPKFSLSEGITKTYNYYIEGIKS